MVCRVSPHRDTLIFAFPESNGVEYDSATRPPLKGEPWSVFIILVDDSDLLVFVGLTATVNAYSDRPFLILDDKINPLI